MKAIRSLIFTYILCFQSTLFGWWDVGHQAVAMMAYDRLHPQVKEEVSRLAATFSEEYPEHASFVALSTWLDYVKKEGNGCFSALHFTDTIYDPEGILSLQQREVIQARSQGNDVVSALNQAERVLSSSANDRLRSLMLAIAIHCVADIHQPLHCTSRYSKTFPFGDRGGGMTLVKAEETPNLHYLWDSGFGLLSFGANLQQVCQEIDGVAFGTFHTSKDPRDWAQEGRLITEQIGYAVIDDEGNIIEEEALIAREVVLERLWLASHRLADFLNRSVGKAVLIKN